MMSGSECSVRIMFWMRDYLPAFRPDVAELFGRELPRLGVCSDLAGQLADGESSSANQAAWKAGEVYVCGRQRGGVLGDLLRTFFDLRLFLFLRPEHSVIQVRDKIRTGLVALLWARFSQRKLTYWMSFPMVEGYWERYIQIGGRRGQIVQCLNWVRAKLAAQAYYRYLLPRVDHLFVQSDAMLAMMSRQGMPRARMTVVPMGVSMSVFTQVQKPAELPKQLHGRKVLAYLGTLGVSRNSDFLLQVLALVREAEPSALLLLVGDGASPDEQAWIRERIASSGLSDHVSLTGWLPQSDALPFLKCAAVGLSPVPRGPLFDVSTPTKTLEYLALGIPCVCNDIPDQKYVIEVSGGGVCVPMEARLFADACLQLLREPEAAASAGARGRAWVKDNRSYDAIAANVAAVYRRLLADKQTAN
ncbi:glycosyltransferase [Paucibacter sp. DJ2R-2]|uniref:glycosyltransferase n=1 Tax=Paucibacter sp. DJ2R-2 TaxID=2893558 RepID=UPI0021E466DE|nr:glycosyltransferase [Paucibacter sp. DJ2R-2]MCV2422815.1 glycosyltransferase [Paucibacter sp. DJ4R-1]MCV2441044.1 glycosyltransferase [Paucibacter sp. DJ2R-2]